MQQSCEYEFSTFVSTAGIVHSSSSPSDDPDLASTGLVPLMDSNRMSVILHHRCTSEYDYEQGILGYLVTILTSLLVSHDETAWLDNHQHK